MALPGPVTGGSRPWERRRPSKRSEWRNSNEGCLKCLRTPTTKRRSTTKMPPGAIRRLPNIMARGTTRRAVKNRRRLTPIRKRRTNTPRGRTARANRRSEAFLARSGQRLASLIHFTLRDGGSDRAFRAAPRGPYMLAGSGAAGLDSGAKQLRQAAVGSSLRTRRPSPSRGLMRGGTGATK
jgi:hypothetical protein